MDQTRLDAIPNELALKLRETGHDGAHELAAGGDEVEAQARLRQHAFIDRAPSREISSLRLRSNILVQELINHGDLNNDMVINFRDYDMLDTVSTYLVDLNDDGVVNVEDKLVLGRVARIARDTLLQDKAFELDSRINPFWDNPPQALRDILERYYPDYDESAKNNGRIDVEDIIDFLEIESIRKKVVGSLPYGMRKRVELGRALALEPKILLLDEPMAGMNLEEKEDITRFIVDIFEGQGATYPDTPVLRDGVSCVVLIEHDMGVVMDIADRIVVLDFGCKIAEGSPAEIRTNPQVISAYLGEQM